VSHSWIHRGVIVAALACALTTAAGAGQVLVFTTIDFPGSILTNAQGINASGDIVGFYQDSGGRPHGFLRSGDQYRSIDFPNASLTQAHGIGPAGDIVGHYQRQNESGAVPAHGFVLTRRGSFLALDYPGHQNTVAQRLLPDGTILGCYHDTDTMDTMHGMEFSRRGFAAMPEATTMHNGATPDGQLIVGLFTDARDGRGKGYVVNRGAFSPLEVPGSVLTNAEDVNPSGVIVGFFQDASGAFHGFQYTGGAFGRVDVPGATATRVFGINVHGDMVGLFVDSGGRRHGFLAQWANQ
jgi:hypothetical protein